VNWERLENEPDYWFDRFDRYARGLGYEYTVKRAWYMYRAALTRKLEANQTADDYPSWVDAANKYSWEVRAKGWAEYDRVQLRVLWEEKRKELAEEDWDTGKELRMFAKDVLQTFELSRNAGVGPNGEQYLAVTVTAGQLTQLLRTATDLQRLGIGEPTSITATTDRTGPQLYLPEVDHEVSSSSNTNHAE
jgi:hypothetical protein